ncbi:MAG: putative WhiB family transcriptional regulator [Ilumatobacteraceae bacterium]|nr:putative WhiB family transcriptional regulator [Ilumatobacteraceae bacterium]MCU1389430.1 putative WhiB family transcriptional regulator [Ilumatobacteraceae bacterium]
MYALTFTELDPTILVGNSALDTGFDVGGLDWTKARCRDGNGTLTHLFFSDEPIAIARAKAICGKCPLSVACLEGALERVEPWGVWGGELIETGRIIVNKRPRGRPPKHPRPIVVINEDAIAVPVRVA